MDADLKTLKLAQDVPRRSMQRLVRRWVASATVESVRKEDGAQCIRYGPDVQDVTWFTGPDRIGNIKEGDRGDLYYESSPSRGRHVFLLNTLDKTER